MYLWYVNQNSNQSQMFHAWKAASTKNGWTKEKLQQSKIEMENISEAKISLN